VIVRRPRRPTAARRCCPATSPDAVLRGDSVVPRAEHSAGGDGRDPFKLNQPNDELEARRFGE
jgi:hypothetical protein